MAIDLIVQHVHSQLEEVRAARSVGGEGGSQPCLAGSCALGAQVGMVWLLLCSRCGSSCELLPALSLRPAKETAFSLCSGWSWLLCQLWSSSSFLPSLGQQVMRGQTSHPPVIQGMCPPACSSPRASIAPNPPLLLDFSSSLPCRYCCAVFSARSPSPLLCCVQLLGFKTQSLAMFESLSRYMLHHFPTAGLKSSPVCPGPVLTSGLGLCNELMAFYVAVPEQQSLLPPHICSFGDVLVMEMLKSDVLTSAGSVT